MAFRLVYTDFWEDPKVMEEMTPEDRYFYLYLLTNPNTNMLGIYQITKKQMAFELGYSPESINSLLDRFENHHKLVRYNQETRELLVKKYAKYNLNKGGKPIIDCIKKELKGIKDTSMLLEIVDLIPNEGIKNTVNDFLRTGIITFEPSKTSIPKDLDNISTRDYIIFRDNQTCFYTGEKLSFNKIQIDHVKPRTDGGTGEPFNLVVTSSNLNNSKSGKDLKVFCKEFNLNYDVIISKLTILEEFENLRTKSNITYRETIENNIHTIDDIVNYINTTRKNNKYDTSTNQNQKQIPNQHLKLVGVVVDDELGTVFDYFTKHNFMLSPAQYDLIKSDYEQFPKDEILKAIEISDNNCKRTYNYFKGVLNKIHTEGIKSEKPKVKISFGLDNSEFGWR